jgi:Helix-turn-helix domain
MLPTSLVHEIDRLLKAGTLSHRKIALRLGVSRGTINAIANGRRGLHGKDPTDNRRAQTPSFAPTRCQDCGYRVYLPCLICSARQHKQRRQLLRR